MGRAKYEAIHYEIFPSLVLLAPYIQTFFSTPCFQIYSVNVFLAVQRSRHTIIKKPLIKF